MKVVVVPVEVKKEAKSACPNTEICPDPDAVLVVDVVVEAVTVDTDVTVEVTVESCVTVVVEPCARVTVETCVMVVV